MNDSATDPVERTAYITCVLCEASCGLEVKLRDEQIDVVQGFLLSRPETAAAIDRRLSSTSIMASELVDVVQSN